MKKFGDETAFDRNYHIKGLKSQQNLSNFKSNHTENQLVESNTIFRLTSSIIAMSIYCALNLYEEIYL